ncbi:MAG: ATP-dependent protease ATPase subunit HslU [Rickettsiaceae bacterium]|nr:ATP-dependent protease ATPase subunit HslU [Rickettsiaceae bacterium]
MKNTPQTKYLGLTPSHIVDELNKNIIGQTEAKKSVAIALRSRYRRKLVSDGLREEIHPKNILMIGPTGVGKTEIARRLAKLSNSPFIKVEATKFTEVGYVGRDVESIIRDLTEIAITNAKIQAKKQVALASRERAIEKILNSLVGITSSQETRDKFKEKIERGELMDSEVEVEVIDNPASNSGFEIPGMPGVAMGVLNITDVLGKAMGSHKTKTKKLSIKDAIEILSAEEADKLIDEEAVTVAAIQSVEDDGIVFLDEIDKIASRGESGGGRGEVSREGVQRDLLPLVEGTTVSTKYGFVKTDHILFIASGAFHLQKPSDLLPELQGRFPVRVELKALNKDDFVRILKETEASLLKQYTALLATENLTIEFSDGAITSIAEIAEQVNSEVENIGARRLHTILEKLLEKVSFDADKMSGTSIVIDEAFVEKELSSIKISTDLTKFIL